MTSNTRVFDKDPIEQYFESIRTCSEENIIVHPLSYVAANEIYEIEEGRSLILTYPKRSIKMIGDEYYVASYEGFPVNSTLINLELQCSDKFASAVIYLVSNGKFPN